MKKSFKFLTILTTIIAFSVCNKAIAKRAPAPKIRPLIYRGVKIIAPNTPQKMGYVEAWDMEENKKVWEKKVYDVVIDPKKEADVQWIFISSLEIKDGRLIVKDERNKIYIVNLPPGILKNIIQIRYSSNPPHSFLFDCEKTAHSLDKLADIIVEYRARHPKSRYEFYSEYKLTSSEIKKIRNAMKKTGIKLEHFWVPVSLDIPGQKPGPYGKGMVDIIGGQTKSTKPSHNSAYISVSGIARPTKDGYYISGYILPIEEIKKYDSKYEYTSRKYKDKKLKIIAKVKEIKASLKVKDSSGRIIFKQGRESAVYLYDIRSIEILK